MTDNVGMTRRPGQQPDPTARPGQNYPKDPRWTQLLIPGPRLWQPTPAAVAAHASLRRREATTTAERKAAKSRRVWARRTRSLLARGRQLVLVDIENIAGGACLTESAVRVAKEALAGTRQIRTTDHVVVGTSHIGLVSVGSSWNGVRYVVRSGPDGADLALLDVLTENIADRFESIVLASGDGIFARAVAELSAAGVPTTVIGRRGHIARSLRMVAVKVISLETSPEPGAAAWPSTAP